MILWHKSVDPATECLTSFVSVATKGDKFRVRIRKRKSLRNKFTIKDKIFETKFDAVKISLLQRFEANPPFRNQLVHVMNVKATTTVPTPESTPIQDTNKTDNSRKTLSSNSLETKLQLIEY
uniref:Uncharacterized protein n=1 Tax=Aplanochytrium stocchinoi TaxID=215587 RepID=A0A7S3LJ62_9STRA|mmetsp:Transcript_35870/g.44505  ORF Transcript_35870/g.44505 Transcript_35870/m.44505 type:complete len:122 (-) Transcript_35870:832-1197(-)